MSHPTPIPVTRIEVSDGLKKTLQEELAKIVSDQPLDIGRLQVIQSFASHAKQLLTALDPTFRRRQFVECETAPEDSSQIGYAPQIGIASSTETYGASLSRELISAIGKMGKKERDPVETINAIAVARDKGLNDIADKLEAQLMGSSQAPSVVETE